MVKFRCGIIHLKLSHLQGNMESLGEDVHAVLPELSQESVEQVVDFLNDVADCPEDLKDLKEDDFESLLVARSARRLLNYLTKKYGEQPLGR